MEINLKNIEEFVFYDKKLQKLLPDLRQQFDQWRFAKTATGLNSLAKRTTADVLNALTPHHVQILEEYFKEKITISKMEYNIITHREFSVNDIPDLSGMSEFKDFCLHTDGKTIHITAWR